MKKIIVLMLVAILILCGCKEKVVENKALEKESMPTETVTITDGKVTSGWAAWNKFFEQTTGEKESEYATAESVININKIYSDNEEVGENITFHEIELRFENEKYIYKNLTEGIYETYEYLIKTSGEINGTGEIATGYFLVNDKDLTFEELEWSVMSSQSTDHIEHQMIVMETSK